MVRLQTIEDVLEKCPQLRLEDIKALREWLKKQPHLLNTDTLSDIYLANFLRRRYYSLERAKQTIDNFITFATLVPEMCKGRSMRRPEMKTALKAQYFAILDGLDPEGHCVFVNFTHDPDANKFDYNVLLRIFTMLFDAWVLENGTASGITCVMDQSVLSVSHMLRTSPSSLKKGTYFNKECAPMSIKTIYIVNATSSVQKIIGFFRPFLEDELFKKLKVFKASEMEKFHGYIPKDMLPQDYGGNRRPLKELHKETLELMQRHEKYYNKGEFVTADESKRRGPEKNANTLFGSEGTFRQLDVD